jgi:hypothetical protein
MDSITAGSQHIAKVLLDTSNDNPIWIHAWGGPNTIARALKTIEENHPEQMAYVAKKIRFVLYLGTGFNLSVLHSSSLGKV